ncbi:serine hydrolase domain-containing protein [Glycomyces tritici]|uniref:Serine hydrolase domain-containing protein n=1 Tax=Glycomyces tritici TaxID=2665176 RepID=A0ABT7YUF9_9ACTN|nr:serine hydrolase domain-containing protein [Glycomyces tritici]MDN3241999.1 serine hydrolase domain-containing protein [Glycomyces tritici]
MRRKFKWLLATALAVIAASAPAAPAQAADHTRTQTLLQQYLQHGGPGAAVYAGDGIDAWTLTSGSASATADRPITPTDHFRAASQTKTFTAAVVLQLVDEGLVDLDAPIERYLPGVVAGNGYDGEAISVRQLLQHTSGVARDVNGAKPGADGTFSLAELVRAGLSRPPLFAPGTGFGYSNVNYHLTGMLIERLTGRTVSEAITEQIIEPLNLTGTSFPGPGDRTLPAPHVPGYQGGRLGPFFYWYETTFNLEMSFAGSAGAITSTLTDLAAFQRALADGEVVSYETLAEMRETATTPAEFGDGYGLGLMRLELSCGGEAWGHAGDLTTGHSSVTMVTDDGRFASLMTNTIVWNSNEPTRYDVVDAALCEGVSA